MENFASNMIAALEMGRRARLDEILQKRQNQIQDRQLAAQEEDRKRKLETENDYQVAQREMAQGRPDVMQIGFPDQYQEIQTKKLGNENTRMKMAEDKQQIRDRLLEQGFQATIADPQNWQGFRKYAVNSGMFNEDELSLNPPSQEDLTKGIGKFRAAAAARTRAANPNQIFENTMKLQSAVQSQPIFKSLQETERAFISINNAPDTMPGQMGLVFGLMKLLDPTSVVRESEQAQVINASGLPGRLQNYATSLQGGKSLNATQVAEIKDAAANLAQAYRDIYARFAAPYRKMAIDHGLNPDEVVMPYGFTGDIRGKPGPQQQPNQDIGLPQGWTVVP